MKPKKIDEYSARKIFYSNKNLFKEIDYELKKDMEFEEKTEINCQKISFFRGIPLVAIYISYKFIYIFFSCFFNNKLGFYKHVYKSAVFSAPDHFMRRSSHR